MLVFVIPGIWDPGKDIITQWDHPLVQREYFSAAGQREQTAFLPCSLLFVTSHPPGAVVLWSFVVASFPP